MEEAKIQMESFTPTIERNAKAYNKNILAVTAYGLAIRQLKR